ncbi:hypothetical protein BGX34_002092, partial [Mortierella sp. NVP85]
MHDPHSQAFRSTSSPKIISIPTCHDPTTSQRVVRWRDIQQYFENAQGVMNGEVAVIFLTNNNLEDLVPLRIAHHPGVVLEVVVTESSRYTSSTPETFRSASTIRDTCSRRITAVSDDDQSLASLSSEDLSPYGHGLVYDTHSPHYVLVRQESSQPKTNQSIHDQLPRLREQQQLLNQRTLQMEQKMEEVQQKMAELQQQMKELQKAQCSEQCARHSDRYARQRIDVVEQPYLLPEHQTQQAGMILQKMQHYQQDTIYRHSLIHYRIRKQLSAPLEGLPVPRFFMVLPRDTSLNDGQRDSSSLTFRLHFLCEGISYSPIKDTKDAGGSKEMWDIHMTNHPGYDIKDPKEFFAKYGSYILTTMYMIKYGATAPGFVVPPLAHSKLMARIGDNHEYLTSVKKDIGRLMGITISHLEDTPSIDIEFSATSRWSLTLADQTELKSYLDNIEDKHFPRDLYRVTAQERHCIWMCSEHRHEWVIQHLKDVVSAVGGMYSEDTKNITISCDTEDERLYDAIIKFCKARTTDDPSLSANIGQLSLTASAFQAGQEVSVTINRLGDLTVDGVTFIQRCNITKLTIKHTPEDTDEDRLVDILNQSLGLEELYIRCNSERSYAIIHLVIATRETTIQEGRISALHILKVTDERWDEVSLFKGFDGYDHITSSVTFSKGSTVLDMDTYMSTQDSMLDVEGSPISNFFRQYGWSISRLAASSHFSDHLATLLDDSTEERGSRLSQLKLSPFSLSTFGLDALDRVIKRSQSLTFLWLSCVSLERESQSEKALLLLGRYGERLKRLTLNGISMEKWLVPFARLLPTANSFPKLDHIYLTCSERHQVPLEFIQWLVAVVQDRSPTALSSKDDSSAGKNPQMRKPFTMLARMYGFILSNVTLRPRDWEILIKAIDLSGLGDLHVRGTNFSSEQLDLLLDCIAAADANSVLLKTLHLGGSELLVGADRPALRTRIQKVAPK